MEHITTTKIQMNQNTAITLGNFDGLHMGHRRLISTMQQKAAEQGLLSVVFSFYPHPMFLFGNRDHQALIMSPEEKKRTIEQMGVDCYVEYPFTKDFAAMAPEDFAVQLIFQAMRCKVLVVGENYRFGKNHAGNVALLQQLGAQYGVEVICIPAVMAQGERVSSTRVRKALVEKDLDLVNALLTEPYFIYGEVVQGKQLGRTIGFPTINVVADPQKLFPPNGVYATKSLYDGQYYPGVTNVGIAPTVHGTRKIVETHLFDFHQVIYGKYIQTQLYAFIRPEQKFDSVDALQKRMTVDAALAREYFQKQ